MRDEYSVNDGNRRHALLPFRYESHNFLQLLAFFILLDK
jgi:hypothetical protein